MPLASRQRQQPSFPPNLSDKDAPNRQVRVTVLSRPEGISERGRAGPRARRRHLADGRVVGGAPSRRVLLPSAHQTVMEVYDAAAKAALLQQLELGMDTGG